MNWQDILKGYIVQRTGTCPKCGEYVERTNKCPKNISPLKGKVGCPMMIQTSYDVTERKTI